MHAQALLYTTRTVYHTYAWGILECRPRYIYIYIFKISMSHDLRVSSLAALARCNYSMDDAWWCI